MGNFIVFAVLAVILYRCATGAGDSCREYSDYTCKQIEKADYNVWFNFPDNDRSYNLGYAKGLSSCGSIASSYAYEKNVEDEDWGYVCCMIAQGSNCYEKHR